MKATIFLLLGLGAASTFACDNYSFCYCTDSDGTHDDATSTTVCNKLGGTMVFDPDPSSNWNICASTTGTGWNNCCFRELCQNSGALGDSQCGASMRAAVACPI